MTRIVILGGGPAGYESALVAAQLGAEVTVIGVGGGPPGNGGVAAGGGLGGSCVLTDCVPSKTLIATSDRVTAFRDAPRVGVGGAVSAEVHVDLRQVNARIKALALQQSEDITERLLHEKVTVLAGAGRFAAEQPPRAHRVEVLDYSGRIIETVEADVVLLATGGTPRVLPTAVPDGERILSWRDVYELTELPEHLIVVGSGVTGAEFASGYCELGVPVTLVSSRDRVLPGEDPDAAEVIEQVFTSRGGTLIKRARASAVRRSDDGVLVELLDGRVVHGSHALMCVGSVPNTPDLGLEHVGVELNADGYIGVDRVSRTNIPSIYAAGDCTGVLLLASVAGMQGRIAMWHALGEAVAPLRLKTVAANIFTHPEIATVGIGYEAITSGAVPARSITLPLATNARAKMQGHSDGFVKVYCRPATGVVVGAVIVAPNASELIFPMALAVQRGLTVADVAGTIGVYPALSGSLAEAARRLMLHDDLD
ncbi:NAD(P)H-quinone dehydrogenase [Jatrophihabitans cynanchi]|uniref:NAD(P)H-quinone dehydrogenase n=1 Tax=Jatrophihabitans cynanchi TaxID=2944128 RepID=A0ABY7K1J2_9ACTN|nr:NAD(P)H-quinone dehydrogenase [Jatrophihabitans sp. SB3-54]WAX58692.1 NAD(P)H-quinone dehydrogenase [Jatrophihabitans sp. SB3-54]